MTCSRSYEECTQQAHPCFQHKMQLWRTDGQPGVALPNHEEWTGPTVRERVADTIERSKANGYDPQYVGRAVLR